ncbi:TPA: plasmid recombination protein [Streptococcus suis]|uniref:plasmid recombination protein n=1 Tax=Bacillota TaxID=1239 RepID=UPI001479019A|nr:MULTISPECIES: plasmid recombination protein [Bacillota]MDY4129140.1 plasmid recombination protein [Peptostreptococcus porci]MDY5974821.1 plasmid recombination protein [Streptococcus hyovaginalis]HEL1762509.1 plasmid recombination protein [Streptococcus suis]
MTYSISLHNGTKWSRQHNVRGARLARKEAHIDENGYHNAFIDKTLKQSYFETFGLAIQEYNAKQKRSDRQIIDYLAKVRDEHKRSPSKKPHASYEMILTIGNRDNHPSVYEAESVLKEWLEEFQKRNPNVVVFGAYFHADEPDAAPHLHIDYYFVKRKNKRGLSLQVSQNGALNEQGYFPTKDENGKLVTPQMQFQHDSRELLRDIALRRGLTVDKTIRGENHKHLDTDLFKKKSELDKVKSEITKAKQDLERIKKEESTTRQKAQRNEKRVAEAKEKMIQFEDNEAYFNQLEHDNLMLDLENKELKRKLSLMKRAFNQLKSFVKSYKLKEGGMWEQAKKNLFQFLGKERYDEFQEIRHEDEKSKLPKRVFNDFER